jgi:hypothetical protein
MSLILALRFRDPAQNLRRKTLKNSLARWLKTSSFALDGELGEEEPELAGGRRGARRREEPCARVARATRRRGHRRVAACMDTRRVDVACGREKQQERRRRWGRDGS